MGVLDPFYSWIEQKQAKSNKCGIWPVELSSSHPFTPACAKHDADYAKYREMAIAEANKKANSPAVRLAALFNDANFIDQWLDKHYEPLIREADNRFSVAMGHIARREKVLAKRFKLAGTHVLFNRVVFRLGWPIWKRKTLHEVLVELGL
jgi:hypothetical protein